MFSYQAKLIEVIDGDQSETSIYMMHGSINFAMVASGNAKERYWK